jgi:hypothetical protein
MSLDCAAKVLDFIVKIFQLIGIPVAIVLYMVNKRKEVRDRDYGTYDTLDDKYIDYLKLCLDYPDLDVADTPKANMGVLTPGQQYREWVLFSILISIMERAYLMYLNTSFQVRTDQWDGWEDYLEEWGKRENFRRALSKLASGFDERFVKYLHTKVQFQEEE